MRSSFSKRLLASLALVSFARADYFIDDQNYTSLLYSENPGGTKLVIPIQQGGAKLSISLSSGAMLPVDASPCFNHTFLPDVQEIVGFNWRTDVTCKLAVDCPVQIPFTGSGITIYVLQAGSEGVNASLTIDEGAPQYNLLSAPPGPNFYIPNVTLFSAQGITTGNHTATMTIQNWNNISSAMMFDYALINQTIVSDISTTTTSSVSSSTAAQITSTPTSTATLSPNPATNVGAIVGGVVGGLAALIGLFLAIFYLCRRRRKAQRSSANLDVEPTIEPFFSPESLYHRGPQGYTDTPERPTSESLLVVTGSVSTQAPPHSTSSDSSRREKSRLDVSNPDASQTTHVNVASSTQASSSSTYPPASKTSRPQIQQTHPMLTDDQADFVNSLYANDVPTGAIARVIKRMMAVEQQPVVDEHGSLPPPSYYHGAGDG